METYIFQFSLVQKKVEQTCPHIGKNKEIGGRRKMDEKNERVGVIICWIFMMLIAISFICILYFNYREIENMRERDENFTKFCEDRFMKFEKDTSPLRFYCYAKYNTNTIIKYEIDIEEGEVYFIERS